MSMRARLYDDGPGVSADGARSGRKSRSELVTVELGGSHYTVECKDSSSLGRLYRVRGNGAARVTPPIEARAMAVAFGECRFKFDDDIATLLSDPYDRDQLEAEMTRLRERIVELELGVSVLTRRGQDRIESLEARIRHSEDRPVAIENALLQTLSIFPVEVVRNVFGLRAPMEGGDTHAPAYTLRGFAEISELMYLAYTKVVVSAALPSLIFAIWIHHREGLESQTTSSILDSAQAVFTAQNLIYSLVSAIVFGKVVSWCSALMVAGVEGYRALSVRAFNATSSAVSSLLQSTKATSLSMARCVGSHRYKLLFACMMVVLCFRQELARRCNNQLRSQACTENLAQLEVLCRHVMESMLGAIASAAARFPHGF